MAEIPRILASDRLAAPSSQVRVNPAALAPFAVFEDIGRRFSAEGAAQLARDTEMRRTTAAITAMGVATAEAEAFADELAGDPDFTTASPRFAARLKEIGEATAGGLDAETRKIFEQKFTDYGLAKLTAVRRDARKAEIGAAVAGLEAQLPTYANQAAAAPNLMLRGFYAGQGVAAIRGLAATGVLDPVDAGRRERAFRSQIEENDVRAAVLGDPERAEAALLDAESFPNLSEEDRLVWLARAQTAADGRRSERARLADKAERDGEKARKEAQDQREIDLMDAILAADRTLGEEELRAELAERRVSREGFSRLRALLNSDESVANDPNVLLALTRDAAAGDAGVPDRIAAAVDNRTLRGGSAAELYRQYDASVRRGGILAQEDVQRARAFVDGTIGGVRGPLAVLDGAVSERVLRATREFDRRIQAEAEQPGFDPNRIADEVVAQFRTAAPLASAFPRPAFLVGPRDRPDVAATRLATLEALDAGEIDAATAARELANLEALEDALAQLPQPSGAAKPKAETP